MKKIALLFVIIIAPLVLLTSRQPAVAAPTQTPTALGWPTFKQTNSKKIVPEVKAIQFLLRARGFYASQPDGVFGPLTTAAVKKFQRSRSLKVDGVVGPATFPKLVQSVKRGARGDAVRAAQILLRETTAHDGGLMFSNLAVDGIFGSETESAVRANQQESRSMRDTTWPQTNGAADVVTWAILFYSNLP